ncbi:putative Co/Zn/Cd efflux system membrane fusion protein [Desulfovibrio sp. DV]|uniref:efflux RND transporter periplasmic adaptor subunit n=1 Tax=Desulfovibrio sp. DV TaxID=1844708 RepID=UPI00094B9B38|nr:efflux RND transporter periplasmic adaptor subunit [Desulfovibrio sp. DV]OLN30369.1 putative Co/Zn/Cd efflux system membrane fusion protein [Desulfovibrio sp. DV]
MPLPTTPLPPASNLAACWAIAVALLLCLPLPGCQEAQSARQSAPVVKTVRVIAESGAEDRTYSGVIVARHEVEESFRVGGRIEKRLVDVGDRVRAGQVLAGLDEKDLRLATESTLAEWKAAISNQEQAATEERRYTTLLARHVVSQSEYDLKHLAGDEARARLEKAERTHKLAVSQLGYANLLASTDGVVTKVSAEAGQVVSPGQSVVAVARDGALEVQADIPERRIADLKNTTAEITLWSNRDVHYRAVLRETAPAADPATRTYAVRYFLPDTDDAVRLGMTATLHLTGPARERIVRIPASALFNQGTGPGVWIVEPRTGKLTLRPVTVDHYSDRDAFVLGPLADGDAIVASGVQKLDAGMTVRLADAPQEDGQ